MNKSRGFTLLEILLVVGIIAILAGIVIVALNPTKQFSQVRNTQRKANLSELNKALYQYYIDNSRYPTSVSTTLTEICATGATSTGHSLNCTNRVDLSYLVPTYLVAIPTDPQATGTSTGYRVMKNSANKIDLFASRAELSSIISIGNTPACATQELGDLVGQACTGTTAVYAGVPGYMTTPSNAGTFQWSTETIVTGVTDDTSGAPNTATLAGLAGVYPAADYCAGLVSGGYDDWYLPTMYELSTILYAHGTELGAGTSWFWASVEYDITNTWLKKFNTGGQGYSSKVNSWMVRCIRRY